MRLLLTSILAVAISYSASSQNYLKGKCQDYIRRSAYIIGQTHKEIIKLDSLHMDGKFATSVAQQRMARNCYEVADYKGAIYHSAYARRLSVLVYSTYNPMFPSKFKDTPEERELIKNSPNDMELQKALLKANPGIQFNDKDYLGDARLFKLDVDDLVQP